MVDIAAEISIVQGKLERLVRRRMVRAEEEGGGLAPAAQEARRAAVDRGGEEDEDEVQEEEQEEEEAEDEETEDYEGQEEEPLQAAVQVPSPTVSEPDAELDPPFGGAATGAAIRMSPGFWQPPPLQLPTSSSSTGAP